MKNKRIGRIRAYAAQVSLMFNQTVNEILDINKTVPELEEGVMFSFDSLSLSKQTKVEGMFRRLHSLVTTAIRNDMKIEWGEADKANDKMLIDILGKKIAENPNLAGWFARNTEAMNAFVSRTENGLNLSDRIWKPVRQLRDEMEVAMTISIGEGESASTIKRRVKKYLNDPDLMFRRFRYKVGEDKEGKPIYAKKWKKRVKDEVTGKYKFIDCDKDSYKTGTGYYKSASKNAMRVTRTETNMAYRRSDNERWKNMDIVLGQKIRTSNGHEEKDICDELAGDYPKEFIFEGWHPQCFCISTPILVDEDEMVKMMKAKRDGKEYTPKGKEIKDVPANFKKWVEDNADKIDEMREKGTEPYFLRHNKGMVDEILNPQAKVITAKDISKKRHDGRTQDQIDSIRKAWAERKAVYKYGRKILDTMGGIDGVDTTKLAEAIKTADRKGIVAEARRLAAIGKDIKNLQYVSDPMKVAKAHGLKKTRELNTAIGTTIDNWLDKYGYEDLYTNKDHAIGKLKFEIDNLKASRKYDTWKEAADSYTMLLRKVEEAKAWDAISAKAAELSYFSTKSSEYKSLLAELNGLIGKKADKKEADAIIAQLEYKKKAMEGSRARRRKGLGIEDVLKHEPKNINDEELNEHLPWIGYREKESVERRIEWVMKNAKDIDRQKAEAYEKAVYGFTYQWDYEIREVQDGRTVTSRKGHALEDICRRAIDIEDYIARAPKWKGARVYRGMSVSEQEIGRIRASLKNGEYGMHGTASWSTSESVASSFSTMHIGETDNRFNIGEKLTRRVIIVCDEQRRGTTIRHMSHFGSEYEVLCSKMSRYELVSEEKSGGIHYFHVKCVKP